jgi:type III restriction enzyme
VLEIMGMDSDQDRATQDVLAQCVDAVNAHSGFGTWASDVVVGEPAAAMGVIGRHV